MCLLPLMVLETHAVHIQRKPPPQDTHGQISGDELAGIRCGAGKARKSDGVVVRPGKAGMFSRSQTCRGRSQSPVVRIAEEMETEPSKPIDKISPGEVTSHRAVTKVNALWPRKVVFPRAEPATTGRRQHEQPNTDRYGWSAGWKRQHGDKDMLSNWRSPPRPSEKSPEPGRPYNRSNREVGRRREGGGWVRSSDEAEQCPWSQGALPFAKSPT